MSFMLPREPTDSGAEPEAPPEIPPRSRLYSLPLLGAGTAGVEAVTSYLARLARAHAVSTWTLLKHEIAAKVLKPGANLRNRLSELTAEMGAAFNGENETSRKLVGVLSDLTMRPELAQGTMSFCAGFISPRKLVSVKQRWCPDCLNEMKIMNHELYYQLIWQILSVKSCPRHRRLLASHCPHCHKYFSPLRANTYPGYCPACHGWLGETGGAQSAEDWGQIAASAVAELLQGRDLVMAAPTSYFPENMRQLLHGHFGGNIAELTRFLRISRSTVIAWIGEIERPSMEYLANVSLKVKVPMAALLSKMLPVEIFDPQPDTAHPERPVFSAPPKVDLDSIRRELELAAHADQPAGLSLNAIAKKLGCNQTTLKRRFPDLAELVKQRYLEYRKNKMEARVQEVKSQVRAAMLSLHHEGIYPSQARLRAKLWGQIDLREPSAQQTWKEYLAELYPGQS